VGSSLSKQSFLLNGRFVNHIPDRRLPARSCAQDENITMAVELAYDGAAIDVVIRSKYFQRGGHHVYSS
jgi:hypothetical protein